MKRRFSLGTFASSDQPHPRHPGDRDGTFAGVVIEHEPGAARVVPVAELLRGETRSLNELLDNWAESFARLAGAVDELPDAARGIPLETLAVRAPIAPRQVFCTGANYRKHVIEIFMSLGGGHTTEHMDTTTRRAFAERLMLERAEHGEPYAFTKPVTTVTGPHATVLLPDIGKEPDWELELGVVFGAHTYNVSREKALAHVAGYVIANDLTMRDRIYRHDIKALGTDWIKGKGSPGFLPTGPFLVPAAFVPAPSELRIVLSLNGKTMQDEMTSEMVFDIPRQIEHISRFAAILPGDLLCTGSPAGNGGHYGRYLRPGDVLEGSITGLGTQRVTFEAKERS